EGGTGDLREVLDRQRHPEQGRAVGELREGAGAAGLRQLRGRGAGLLTAEVLEQMSECSHLRPGGPRRDERALGELLDVELPAAQRGGGLAGSSLRLVPIAHRRSPADSSTAARTWSTIPGRASSICSQADSKPLSSPYQGSRMPVSSTACGAKSRTIRSEEHTSELQSRFDLVC